MVRALLLAVAALTLASAAQAAPGAALPAAAPVDAMRFDASGLITPAVADALRQIKAAAPAWTNVNLTVGNGPGFVSITEPSLRVSVNGSRSGAGAAYFSGFAGNDSVSFSTSYFGGGWTLFGSGVNVTVSPFGNGYSVWGSVGATSVNCQINRFGSSVSLWGQSGANLNVSGWGNNLQIYGQIDETRFSRSALAVLAATLSLAAPVTK